jgi:hypothetical protein
MDYLYSTRRRDVFPSSPDEEKKGQRGGPVSYSNSASSSPGSSRSSSSDAMVSSWSWIMSFVREPRTVFWPMGWTSARAVRMRAR